MKIKRFLIGAFVVVCMMFMSNFVVSAASSGNCGKTCTWILDDEGTLTISGSGRMTDYSKDMYHDIPWYSHMTEIKKAVINGPETIGDRAFFYAGNMKEVIIGSSVKSIGEAAFTGCTSLSNIDIPSNVTKIFSSAFSGCRGITKLTIPDTVTLLGSKVFEDMNSLKELTVPFIGTAADNLGHLGWWFQSTTTKVPGYTWTRYDGKYYLIPTTLTKITVTSCRVRPYGFNNCDFLTDISKKDHTGGRATCTSPAVCEVCRQTYGEKDASNHTGETEIKNKKIATCLEAGYTGDIYCKGCKKLLEAGTETEALGHDMTRIVSEKVEPTCEVDGKEAVIGCSRCNYTEGGIILKAFGHIWDVGKITKEPDEDSEGIKIYTCEKCNKTRTEFIPKKESTQRPQPSQPVQPTQPVQKPQPTPQPTQKPQQSQSNVGRVDDKKTGKYIITNAVKKEVAFITPMSKNRKTFIIPNTVKINGMTYKITQIANNAFRNNKKITKVTIGNNIRSIGNNAFRGTARLKTVVIGKNVSKIGSYAFSGCKKLKTIIIKTRKLTAKTVSEKAFKGTPKITTAKVPGNKMKTYKKLLKEKGLNSKRIVKG